MAVMLLLLGTKLLSSRSTALPPFIRLLSTTLSSPSNRQLLQDYLVNSCELSLAEATRAMKQIPCITPLSTPHSVVQFLKQNGLDTAQVRTAVLRDPRILSRDVEKHIKPRMEALQRLGFSLSDIARLFYLHPSAFRCCSLEQKIQFWLPVAGSVENLLHLLKSSRYALTTDTDKVVAPNLDFLQTSFGLSCSQLVKSTALRLLPGNPKNVKNIAKRAMEFGVPICSPAFKHILSACAQNSQKIKSKIESLTSLGWSESEVLSMIRKQPSLLRHSAEIIRCKANFLKNDVGLDLAIIAQFPILLMLSMNKRLVPRYRVLMELKTARLFDTKKVPIYRCLLSYTEQKFLERFVFPNLGSIPNLYKTYTDIAGVNVPIKRGQTDQAKLLRALGFSESEGSNIIAKERNLVRKTKEQMRATIDFLTTHVGLNRSYIASHPKILKYSLKRRLIPRYYVIKCLELKGLLKNNCFSAVMNLKETDFVEKFINSYEGCFPRLAEDYDSARAGVALK